METLLKNLIGLLTNRAFYGAILTIAGQVGLAFSTEAAVQIGGAVATLIGFGLALYAPSPK